MEKNIENIGVITDGDEGDKYQSFKERLARGTNIRRDDK